MLGEGIFGSVVLGGAKDEVKARAIMSPSVSHGAKRTDTDGIVSCPLEASR